MSRPWVRRAAIALAVLLVILAFWLATRPGPTVEVVRTERRDIVELIIASGSLRATRQSNVGTDVGGVVEQVLVREGDQVAAGQTIATLERGDIEQQIQQAELAVRTAEAELARARRPANPEDLARARAELDQARRVGTARLDQARQRLAQLERGGRPEERQRAEEALRQAQANRRQAELDYQRAQQLFERGAIARAELDRARTQVDISRAAERSAEQQLALARQPASVEEIAAARADVRAAQATLDESVRIAQQNLRALQAIPRREEVQVAEARAREAVAALRRAQVEAARRTITAPFSGLVVTRNIEPGQSVTPGVPILVIADMSRTEVVVETDETNLPRLSTGQPVLLIAPAFPDRPFRGTLTEIGPEVDAQRGVVALRIRPEELPDFARPDITVDANIEVERYPDALSVPVAGLQTENGRDYVLVLEEGRAVRRPVRVLARGEDFAAVEGIPEGTPVIARAGEIDAGQRVRVAGM